MAREPYMTLLLAIGLSIPYGLPAQASDTIPKTAPSADIFSGTVMQLTERSLIVERKVPGQQPVTREFTRDAETTVEGKLRNRARVTVRYKALAEGGLVAVHIIVR